MNKLKNSKQLKALVKNIKLNPSDKSCKINLAKKFNEIADELISESFLVDSDDIKIKNLLDSAIHYMYTLNIINSIQNSLVDKSDDLYQQSIIMLEDVRQNIIAINALMSEIMSNCIIMTSLTEIDIASDDFIKNLSKKSILSTIRLRVNEQIAIIQELADDSDREVDYINYSKELLSEITFNIKDYLSNLTNEIVEWLGPPPCRFELIGLGSMSMSQLTPYSDLEFAILTENDEYKNSLNPLHIQNYFKNLSYYLYFRIICLGETPLPTSYYGINLDDFIKRGICFDLGGKTPLGRLECDKEYDLICTKEQMLSYLKNEYIVSVETRRDKNLSYILENTSFITAFNKDGTLYNMTDGDTILSKYQKEANCFFNSLVQTTASESKLTDDAEHLRSLSIAEERALSILKGNIDFESELSKLDSEGFKKEGRFFNVKKEIYRVPDRLIYELGILHQIEFNISGINAYEIINYLFDNNIINAESTRYLQKAVSFANLLRLRSYSYYSQQKEMMDIIANLSANPLQEEILIDSSSDSKNKFKLNHSELEEDNSLFEFYYITIPLLKSLKKLCNTDLLIYNIDERTKYFSEELFFSDEDRIKAEIYMRLSQYKNAESYLIKEFENQSKKLLQYADEASTAEIIPSDLKYSIIRVINAGSNLAYIYKILGQYDKAISNTRNVLELLNKFPSISKDEKLNIAKLNNYLGCLYNSKGDYIEAEEFLLKSLKLKKEMSADEDVNLITSLNSLGILYDNKGEYPKALEYFNQAIDITRKKIGVDSFEIAALLNNRANIYDSLAKYDEAIKDYNEVERIYSKIYNKSHPNIAILFNNTASIYEKKGDFDKALEFYEHAAKLITAIFKSNTHANLAIIYKNIAILHNKQADNKSALEYFEKALPIALKNFGKYSLKTLQFYADIFGICEQLEDYASSLTYQLEILDIMKKLFGEDRPEIAVTYENIGKNYLKIGNELLALDNFESALTIFKNNGAEYNVKFNELLNFVKEKYSELDDSYKYGTDNKIRLWVKLVSVKGDFMDKKIIAAPQEKLAADTKSKIVNTTITDETLSSHGSNRKYWYSIEDFQRLLLGLRKLKLDFHKEDGSEYEVKGGEYYSSVRENAAHIFLADPYHLSNFDNYLEDDIKIITGTHDIESRNNKWYQPPKTIIIPLLEGGHWRSIRIEIAYASTVEETKIKILFSDPYGNRGFNDDLKTQLKTSISIQLGKLLKTHYSLSEDTYEILDTNIEIFEKDFDQQGRGNNGYDCGPITFANIEDYISDTPNRDFIDSTKYTLKAATDEAYESSLISRRNHDLEIYQEVSGEEVAQIALERAEIYNSFIIDEIKQFKEHFLKNTKVIKDKKETDISYKIGKLNDDELLLFWRILKNYKIAYNLSDNDLTDEQLHEIYDQYRSNIEIEDNIEFDSISLPPTNRFYLQDKNNFTELLKSIEHFNSSSKNMQDYIDILTKISDSFNALNWNEMDPNCIRNHHGYRNRVKTKYQEKGEPSNNALNVKGAKIDFELFSNCDELARYLKIIKDTEQAIYIKDTFNEYLKILENKLNFVIGESQKIEVYDEIVVTNFKDIVSYVNDKKLSNDILQLLEEYKNLFYNDDDSNGLRDSNDIYAFIRILQKIGENAKNFSEVFFAKNTDHLIEKKELMALSNILKYLANYRDFLIHNTELLSNQDIIINGDTNKEIFNKIKNKFEVDLNITVLIELFNKIKIFIDNLFDETNDIDKHNKNYEGELYKFLNDECEVILSRYSKLPKIETESYKSFEYLQPLDKIKELVSTYYKLINDTNILENSKVFNLEMLDDQQVIKINKKLKILKKGKIIPNLRAGQINKTSLINFIYETKERGELTEDDYTDYIIEETIRKYTNVSLNKLIEDYIKDEAQILSEIKISFSADDAQNLEKSLQEIIKLIQEDVDINSKDFKICLSRLIKSFNKTGVFIEEYTEEFVEQVVSDKFKSELQEYINQQLQQQIKQQIDEIIISNIIKGASYENADAVLNFYNFSMSLKNSLAVENSIELSTNPNDISLILRHIEEIDELLNSEINEKDLKKHELAREAYIGILREYIKPIFIESENNLLKGFILQNLFNESITNSILHANKVMHLEEIQKGETEFYLQLVATWKEHFKALDAILRLESKTIAEIIPEKYKKLYQLADDKLKEKIHIYIKISQYNLLDRRKEAKELFDDDLIQFCKEGEIELAIDDQYKNEFRLLLLDQWLIINSKNYDDECIDIIEEKIKICHEFISKKIDVTLYNKKLIGAYFALAYQANSQFKKSGDKSFLVKMNNNLRKAKELNRNKNNEIIDKFTESYIEISMIIFSESNKEIKANEFKKMLSRIIEGEEFYGLISVQHTILLLLYDLTNDASYAHKAHDLFKENSLYFIQNGGIHTEKSYNSSEYLLGQRNILTYAQKGNFEELKLIIEKNLQLIDYKSEEFGNTALIFATYNGHEKIVEYLISKGANLNLQNNEGSTALFLSIDKGYTKISELLIDKGANINIANNEAITPLMHSAKKGYLQIVDKLLPKLEIEDINAKTERGETALYNACFNNHTDIAKLLIEKGADPLISTNKSESILLAAAYQGNKELVELFIEKFPELINQTTFQNVTPLYVAIDKGHTEIAELLIDNGANLENLVNNNTILMLAANRGLDRVVSKLIEISDETGERAVSDDILNYVNPDSGLNALIAAVEGGYEKIAVNLIKTGINIDQALKDNGNTALMLAANEGFKDVVEELIRREANLNLKNKEGTMGLHAAIDKRHTEIAELLIDNGADVNAKLGDGTSILILAAKSNCCAIIHKVLTERYSEINIAETDSKGLNALMYACIKGNIEAVRTILGSFRSIINNKSESNGDTALMFAVNNGYKIIVEYLISTGANLDLQNKAGLTALHLAIDKDYTEIAELLIDKGADVNLANSLNQTPLIFAAMLNNQAIIKKLLEKNANTDIEDGNGLKAIILAASNGHSEVVQLLLDEDEDPNQIISNGETLLMLACQKGYFEIVEALLKAGADPKLETDQGLTALMCVCHNGNVKTVRLIADLLEEEGINKQTMEGISSLMIAVKGGSCEIVKMLLEKGATIEAATTLELAVESNNKEIILLIIEKGDMGSSINDLGPPLLTKALYNKSLNSVEALLEVGLNPNFEVHGGTPLIRAAITGQTEAVRLLLEHGAEVNKQLLNQKTALHLAAEKGHLKIVELLVTAGADLNIPSAEGDTALMFAANNGHKGVVEYLISKEANLDLQNKAGLTALYLAIDKNYTEIAELLIDNGADINAKLGDGTSILILAAKSNCCAIIHKVLTEGYSEINIAETDSKGLNALMYACIKGNIEAVITMSDFISDIINNKSINNEDTALMFAANNGHLDIVEYLISTGANFDLQNKAGLTALHLAIDKNYTEIAELLIDKGADVNLTNNSNQTPLIYATILNNQKVVQKLLEKNADTDIKDCKDLTAFDLASILNRDEILKELANYKSLIEPGSIAAGPASELATIDTTNLAGESSSGGDGEYA